ncbi:ABC transporter permease subunit [Actinoplanes sp. NEAU-A12]|uniref:ABC transporter permease subunit n=1 Tax=Actinoplanes sandaracinus TaxID=3045177 RepID=A0ABT6WHY3_9ACTN|nr:ABC transporter permease subunit [Actinoplanes sandaracinus]MDI6099345.1 ABC transporter permease subunit [Actinoplanes sandaracinus]
MTGFGRLTRTEWTKFRTVRGRLAAMLVAGGVILGLALSPMSGTCTRDTCGQPVGPEGEQVRDSFYFLHQPLTGDGAITARLTSMTGLLPPEPGSASEDDERAAIGPGGSGGMRPGLVPWAKAGLIVKDGTGQGTTYAAVMATGGHGVRMQHDYVHDRAGQPGAVSDTAPRWLRLTRDGDTITGEESTDGVIWTTVGAAELDGLPATVRIGLFVTSPQHVEALGAAGSASAPTVAAATFDAITRTGAGAGPGWSGEAIGEPPGTPEQERGRHEPAGDGFVLTGSGDIAPAVAGAAGLGVSVTQTLAGTFAGLVLVVVVGTVFMTGEYRRGMIRTTLAASPRRGRMLLAKAVVVGGVTFVVGLVSAAAAVTIGRESLLDNGVYVLPVSTPTAWRMIVGTGALLAVAAVLALGIGAMLRRSAGAITAVIVLTVLPYLLALTVLPATAGQWLLRVTPAAAFAVQQSAKQYAQVENLYTPAGGYFPLPWWAGFAVLCLWAGAALAGAGVLLRRRDA